MVFRQDILNMDIKNKQFKNSMSEKQVCSEIGIARSTLYRLSVGKSITTETLVKCIRWTEKDLNRYFN